MWKETDRLGVARLIWCFLEHIVLIWTWAPWLGSDRAQVLTWQCGDRPDRSVKSHWSQPLLADPDRSSMAIALYPWVDPDLRIYMCRSCLFQKRDPHLMIVLALIWYIQLLVTLSRSAWNVCVMDFLHSIWSHTLCIFSITCCRYDVYFDPKNVRIDLFMPWRGRHLYRGIWEII